MTREEFFDDLMPGTIGPRAWRPAARKRMLAAGMEVVPYIAEVLAMPGRPAEYSEKACWALLREVAGADIQAEPYWRKSYVGQDGKIRTCYLLWLAARGYRPGPKGHHP